jgi:hypothetical protein
MHRRAAQSSRGARAPGSARCAGARCPRTVWDDESKKRHLEEHLGSGADVDQFIGPYLAAHFRDPRSYVRLPQQSAPDFPPYHGLASKNGDRRAWTVEVRVHEDINITPDGLILEEIWLDGHDLFDELPDDFKGMARVSPDEERLEVAVAARIEERLGETNP